MNETRCTCACGDLAAQWHDEYCPRAEGVPYVTTDDRHRCQQLGRDLGIAEEPLLMDRLIAAVTAMRNESWRGGYDAGVLYASGGLLIAAAALDRVKALVAEGHRADEATETDDYQYDEATEAKRYMATRITAALNDQEIR